MPAISLGQAAKQVGCSPSAARTYTTRFPEVFSSSATPTAGRPRRFTPEDVRALRFIAELSRTGLSLDEIGDALRRGELDAYQPEPEPKGDGEQGQALALALTTLGNQLDAAREREATLWDRVASLEREKGEIAGELRAIQAELTRVRARGFWARLLGR